MNEENKKVKAVGLISGGLDSILAARHMKDLGVEVAGIFFSMPWGCGDETSAVNLCRKIGIPLAVKELDESYLNIIKNPSHGYGAALNPCVDCKIFMLKRAAEYLKTIGAEFIFTGDVIGQRPMSQLKHSLRLIDKKTGLQGKLLRPLSAQFLDPTEVETRGLIDRKQLFNFSGRSRKAQMKMAKEFGIDEYAQPAGGCLLTDKNFSSRMRDVFRYGFRNFEELIALQWGRHFRISEKFKAILGRDKSENDHLIRTAHADDRVIQLSDNLGPTCILKGVNPDNGILEICAGLLQRFSKRKKDAPSNILTWTLKNPHEKQIVMPRHLEEKEIETMKISATGL